VASAASSGARGTKLGSASSIPLSTSSRGASFVSRPGSLPNQASQGVQDPAIVHQRTPRFLPVGVTCDPANSMNTPRFLPNGAECAGVLVQLVLNTLVPPETRQQSAVVTPENQSGA
jgi:hypothetical protein